MTWPIGSPSRLPCDAQLGDSVPHVPAEAEAKVEKASHPGCLVAPKGDGKERSAEGKDDAVEGKPALVSGNMTASSKPNEQVETSQSEAPYQYRLLQWAMDRWHWHLKEADDQEVETLIPKQVKTTQEGPELSIPELCFFGINCKIAGCTKNHSTPGGINRKTQGVQGASLTSSPEATDSQTTPTVMRVKVVPTIA